MSGVLFSENNFARTPVSASELEEWLRVSEAKFAGLTTGPCEMKSRVAAVLWLGPVAAVLCLGWAVIASQEATRNKSSRTVQPHHSTQTLARQNQYAMSSTQSLWPTSGNCQPRIRAAARRTHRGRNMLAPWDHPLIIMLIIG